MITAKDHNINNYSIDNPSKNSHNDYVDAGNNIAEKAKERLKDIYKDIVVNDVSKSMEAAENSLKQYIEEVKTELTNDFCGAIYDNDELVTKKADEIIEKIDEEIIKQIEDKFEELNKLMKENKTEENNLLEDMINLNSKGLDTLTDDNKQINSLLDSLKKSLIEAESSLRKDIESFKVLYVEVEETSSSYINKSFDNLLDVIKGQLSEIEEKIDGYVLDIEANLKDISNKISDTVNSNSKELNSNIEKLRAEYVETKQRHFEQFKKFQYVIISEALVIILMLMFITFR